MEMTSDITSTYEFISVTVQVTLPSPWWWLWPWSTHTLPESLLMLPILPSVDSLLACFTMRPYFASRPCPTSTLRWNEFFFFPASGNSNVTNKSSLSYQCYFWLVLEKNIMNLEFFFCQTVDFKQGKCELRPALLYRSFDIILLFENF